MGGRGNAGERNSVKDYLAEWKSNEVKAVVDELEKYRAKVMEWKDKPLMERTALERNIPQMYLQVVKRNFKDDEAKTRVFNNLATQLVEDHFEALKDKVEKDIGTITDIRRIGGANDYDITGSSGETVRIQVVMAGGYNKQRLHTRWMKSKLKKKGE